MSTWVVRRELRTLDFDIENRPLTYWADRPSAEITAIAWSWVGSPRIECAVLTTDPDSLGQALARFLTAYEQADLVTGHYIRKHDLPIVNGALMELGMPMLSPKLSSDTKLDLLRRGDLPASQEALAGFLGIAAHKVHMTQAGWREANRLTPEGIAKTKKRVVGDVRQHKQMRAELLRRGLLNPPRTWRP